MAITLIGMPRFMQIKLNANTSNFLRDIYCFIAATRILSFIGIIMLFLPCLWAEIIIHRGLVSREIIILFLGAIWARSVACLINDWFDRNLDKYVKRTQFRPFIQYPVSLGLIAISAVFIIIPAAAFLMILPVKASVIAIFAGAGITIYPFCKRLIWCPQLFLGIIYNFGIFMAWAISGAQFSWKLIILYIFGVLWIVECDTIYGYQDYADDRRAGIKSLSLYLGFAKGKIFLCFVQAVRYMLLGLLSASLTSNVVLMIFTIFIYKNLLKLDLANPKACQRLFYTTAPIEGTAVTIWLLYQI